MKNLIFLLTFSSIFFLACNADTSSKKVIPDAELWEIFKSDFSSAIGKNDLQGIVKLIDFPLEGNFFETNTGKGLSRAGVLKNYQKIIGNNVRLRVIDTKKEEWSEMKIDTEEAAKIFGIPMGETAKVLMLNFVFNQGEENQTESSQVFYFAKVKDDYKWCSMQIIG